MYASPRSVTTASYMSSPLRWDTEVMEHFMTTVHNNPDFLQDLQHIQRNTVFETQMVSVIENPQEHLQEYFQSDSHHVLKEMESPQPCQIETTAAEPHPAIQPVRLSELDINDLSMSILEDIVLDPAVQDALFSPMSN